MAGYISRDLSCFDFRRFVAVCAPVVGTGASGGHAAGEDLTARSLASAGLAALVALPFLLLSSVVLAAPLALPAVIGLGYLAVSHALGAQHRRLAAFINAFVLFALVGWLLLFLLFGEGQSSQSGLTAALMAPLLAAAPAVARSLISARKAQLTPAAQGSRDEALHQLAPAEPILEGGRSVSGCGDAEFAKRLVNRTADLTPVSAAVKSARRDVRAAEPHRPRCDIGDAIAFALRHAESKARAKKAVLASAVEPDVAAACDRQIGRRILHLLIDCGLAGSQAGGVVHVVARRLRGVVLLRVVSALGTLDDEGAEADVRFDIAPLRALVEIAGGTLVVDREGHDIALSVRLDLAVAREPKARVEGNA